MSLKTSDVDYTVDPNTPPDYTKDPDEGLIRPRSRIDYYISDDTFIYEYPPESEWEWDEE